MFVLKVITLGGALGALAGCGPWVGGGGGDSDGDGSTGGTMGGSSPASTSQPLPSTGGGPSTSVGTTDAMTTDGTEGGSTTDPGECGCPDSVAVDFDEPVREGFSAADVIDQLGSTDLAWEWEQVETQPTTTAHATIAYEGGRVLAGPGGDSGCDFILQPCPDGVTVPVRIDFTTDDGFLAESFHGMLEGVLGDEVLVHGDSIAVDEIQGTLPQQALLDHLDEGPFTLSWISLSMRFARSPGDGFRNGFLWAGGQPSAQSLGSGRLP